MSRIVFATFGSLGDLHPVIAIAQELQKRGHEVEIATNETYREKLDALGLPFRPVRPDLLAVGEHVIVEIMEGHRGTERLMKDRMFPAIRDMYADLLPVVAGADLLVASELVYAAPLLAAKQGIRWVGFCFAPISLWSELDPPVLPLPAALRWLPRAGSWVPRAFHYFGRRITRPWCQPVFDLRRELGLPEGGHPIFEGKFSPACYLALFSRVLQAPQTDWPPQTVQTGFCFYDEGASQSTLPPAVADFLAAGEAPVVFTLGSAAIYVAGEFYTESARAVQKLGRRAILLLGKNPPPPNLPSSILACDYLPYGQIFPRAATIVHQGGVGTTAQALRAGRPMLIVPFAHDQFDNAARIVKLGAGRTLSRSCYRSTRVARELTQLDHPEYALAGKRVAHQVGAEDGVGVAAEALERVLRDLAPRPHG